MGQCCGFVSNDKSSSSKENKEEKYKEIEKAINKMEDGKKKNQLLRELNERNSIVISKEQYTADLTEIQHKIYEGPNKNRESQDNTMQSKEELELAAQNLQSDQKIPINNNNSQEKATATGDQPQSGEVNHQSSQGNGVENQSTTHNDSKLNAIKEQKNSRENFLNPVEKQKSQEISKQKEQQGQKPKKSPQKDQEENGKNDKENNQNVEQQQQSGKKGKGEKKGSQSNLKDKNNPDNNQDKKNVGFAIEEIDQIVSKTRNRNQSEGHQTEADLETTKTEKVKGVLKKYSDVQSCYTIEGGEKKKKKKVKFRDPQKPKKKVPKRTHR